MVTELLPEILSSGPNLKDSITLFGIKKKKKANHLSLPAENKTSISK